MKLSYVLWVLVATVIVGGLFVVSAIDKEPTPAPVTFSGDLAEEGVLRETRQMRSSLLGVSESVIYTASTDVAISGFYVRVIQAPVLVQPDGSPVRFWCSRWKKGATKSQDIVLNEVEIGPATNLFLLHGLRDEELGSAFSRDLYIMLLSAGDSIHCFMRTDSALTTEAVVQIYLAGIRY